MPYIGNTIRAADDYRLIDDISSGFNGSTTSFALQVAGSAPVPFPKSPQQVLISVNGVIQEPDPTGASGFNLVGTNIVFSSAPTNGHAFFGIIYATADYLNAGGNFPAGSLGAPSITFIGDENSGLFRKSGGSVGFVSDATEIANFDSNGITISSGNLIIPDSIIHNGDTNTKIRFPSADTVTIETAGSERFRIDSGGDTAFSGTIQIPDSIQHEGDTNTKIRFPSNDEVSIETAGVERVTLSASEVRFNDTGTDTDFVVEGDSNSALFYIDASTDRVCIGDNNPDNIFHVVTSDTTVAKFETGDSGATGAKIRLFHNSSSPADNDTVGQIIFQGKDDGGSTTDYGILKGAAQDVTNGTEDGEFTFHTMTAGTSSEKFRLDADGVRLQNLANGGGLVINHTTTTGNSGSLIFNSNRTGDNDVLGLIRADWNSDSVAEIDLLAATDTANKDNGKIAFKTQNNNAGGLVTRMLLNEDGQVLIGGTSNGGAPNTNERVIVYGNANNNSRIALVAQHNDDNPGTFIVGKSRSTGNTILGTNDDVGQLDFSGNDGNGFHIMARILCSCSGAGTGNDNIPGDLRFFTLPASSTTIQERVRINSAGKFLVNTTSGANFTNNVAEFVNDTADGVVGVRSETGANQQDFILFKFGGGPTDCGGIRRDGTTQGPELFSNSDRRIKTNISDMDNTLDKINQLSLKKFDFKDGSGSGIGLIAQDLVSIFPNKVKKDASDDGTGDTVPDGVDPWTVGHNFTYELLKAVQELTARVAALEAA